jgi:D-lactate dehydrogenase
MKAAFFEIREWEKRVVKKELKGFSLKFFKEELNEENVKKIKDVEIVSVFLGSKINKKIIKSIPKLKLIVTRSTGYDHVDIREAKRKKIVVCNRPRYGENTVAEHTFALILALSRKVHKSYLRSLVGDFSIEGLKGFDLDGKTLGVLGTGRIGKHVIRIARGFNMKILACSHSEDSFLAEQLNFKYVKFNELLKKSDIITIHVPYRKENRHLINSRAFRKMKKGAILINTARGALVDTKALMRALEKKKVAGAGLDVLEGEEFLKEEKEFLYDTAKREALKQLALDHKLLAMDNVVYTPHIAFFSQEALERIIMNTIDDIKDFAKGHEVGECRVV